MPESAVARKTRWQPSEKRSRPSALDIIDDSVRTPRFGSFANSLADTPDEDSVVEAVNAQYMLAQRSMLMIGRYLVRARAQFRGTFQSAIVPRLKVKYRTAHMLMELAVRVDEGVIAEDCLPTSYRAAYRLITLAPPDLEKAKTLGLVRPETEQKAVEDFRRELRLSSLTRQAALAQRRHDLQIELDRLRKRQADLEQELGRISSEIEDAFRGPVIDGEAEDVIQS